MSAYVERWSPSARRDFEDIIASILTRWSEKVVLSFISDLERKLAFIKKYPFGFPIVPSHPGIRKCIVNKHISLYYSLNGPILEVLRLYVNYKNPEDLKL